MVVGHLARKVEKVERLTESIADAVDEDEAQVRQLKHDLDRTMCNIFLWFCMCFFFQTQKVS